MLRPRAVPALSQPTLGVLAELQKDVDDAGSYAARVERAKSRWGSAKDLAKSKPAFAEIKSSLTAMCWGARRCAYCEDSVADEIEHVRPKDLYPDRVFSWDNYLYACGPCNGPKNNHFAVFGDAMTDVATDVGRAQKAAIVPPIAGDAVMLDPRRDDPLDYLWLDIQDTFTFVPRAGIAPRLASRARYTIELLHLNDRAYVLSGRRTAYAQLFNALDAAASDVERKQAVKPHRREAVQNTSHRCVWEEMKRQRAAIPELASLFALATDALTW